MKFEKFVKKAHRITPTDYSVCCQIEQWRHSHVPIEKYPYEYGVSIIKDGSSKYFKSKSPKKVLSKLQNYFDTL